MVDIYLRTADDDLSLDELALYHLMMDYRAAEGLPTIPLSKALTTTAGRHALDTVENVGAYVGHAWSDAPYVSGDSSTYPAIWQAPQRLGTGYGGNGFEISYGFGGAAVRTATVDPARALAAWQASPGHDAVIVNEGPWWAPWEAIGLGIRAGVAHVWFGHVADPDVPTIMGMSAGDAVVGTAYGDIVKAGGGKDTVDGGDGDDRLTGSGGGDVLVGAGGDDTLLGGGGNDVLAGGPGDDRLVGGRGRDVFVIEPGVGTDVIGDFRNRQDRIDLSDLPDVDGFGDLAVRRVWRDVVVEAGEATIVIEATRRGAIDADDFLF